MFLRLCHFCLFSLVFASPNWVNLGEAGRPAQTSEPWKVTHDPLKPPALVTFSVTGLSSALNSNRCLPQLSVRVQELSAGRQKPSQSPSNFRNPCLFLPRVFQACTVPYFPLRYPLTPGWPPGLSTA